MMLGIASVVILVLSLSVSRSGLMLLFAALAAVFAVLLGHISRSKVQGRPGLKSASSMTGLITGYVGLGLLPVLLGPLLVSSIPVPGSPYTIQDCVDAIYSVDPFAKSFIDDLYLDVSGRTPTETCELMALTGGESFTTWVDGILAD
jgi:hypothetical protein